MKKTGKAIGTVIDYAGETKHKEREVVESELAPVLKTYKELETYLKGIVGKTKVATSGYFNPIHKNHISNIISSKHLDSAFLKHHDLPPDTHLTVIVNGDWSTREKLDGELFMSAEYRAEVVRAIVGVDLVFIHEVECTHQGPLIERGLFDVFTKGGDRDFASLPQKEQDALIATKTLMVGNVGYEKFEGTDKEVSSSKLRAFAKDNSR